MVRTIIESIFASRYPTLRIDAQTIDTWVLEISVKQYSEEILSKCAQILINDDSIKLTIATFIGICENIKKESIIKLPVQPSTVCQYCNNTGLTVFALMFDTDSLLISQNTVMNCKCGIKNINNLAKCYEFAPKRNVVYGGYIKVYTRLQLNYVLDRIKKNGNKDFAIDFSTDKSYLEYKKRYEENVSLISGAREI
jgi:hypothetical protein